MDQTLSSPVTLMTDAQIRQYVEQAHRDKYADGSILGSLAEKCRQRPEGIVLLGMTSIAKHLVNLFGGHGRVLAIADDSPKKQGWSYRGVPVMPLDEAMRLPVKQFACAAIEGRFELVGRVLVHPAYANQPIAYAPDDPASTHRDPWKHDTFYRGLSQALSTGPATRIGRQTLLFLVEALRSSLHLPGDVLELGVLQGGSAFGLAHALLDAGRTDKELVLLDLFEEQPADCPVWTMCLDEVKSHLAIYPRATIRQGNIDDHPEWIVNGRYCFVHYDFDFNVQWLDWIWPTIVPGGMLVLDNYGHVPGLSALFDAWFAARGHRVAVSGHNVQGWVIKHD
jgi:O-methyltransferase